MFKDWDLNHEFHELHETNRTPEPFGTDFVLLRTTEGAKRNEVRLEAMSREESKVIGILTTNFTNYTKQTELLRSPDAHRGVSKPCPEFIEGDLDFVIRILDLI